MGDLLLAILDRVIGKKVGVFVAAAGLAYFGIQNMDTEKGKAFVDVLTWLTGLYLGSEGASDVVKAVRGQLPVLTQLIQKKAVGEERESVKDVTVVRTKQTDLGTATIEVAVAGDQLSSQKAAVTAGQVLRAVKDDVT